MAKIKTVGLVIAKAAIDDPKGNCKISSLMKGEVVCQAATERTSDLTIGNLLEQEVDYICPWHFLRSGKAQIGKKLAIAMLWKKRHRRLFPKIIRGKYLPLTLTASVDNAAICPLDDKGKWKPI